MVTWGLVLTSDTCLECGQRVEDGVAAAISANIAEILLRVDGAGTKTQKAKVTSNEGSSDGIINKDMISSRVDMLGCTILSRSCCQLSGLEQESTSDVMLTPCAMRVVVSYAAETFPTALADVDPASLQPRFAKALDLDSVDVMLLDDVTQDVSPFGYEDSYSADVYEAELVPSAGVLGQLPDS